MKSAGTRTGARTSRWISKADLVTLWEVPAGRRQAPLVITGGKKSTAPQGSSATLKPMRFPLAAVLLFSSVAAFAQVDPQVANRLAAQNALFEESWQTTLRLSPLLATNVGDYRYNDQLGDYSLASDRKAPRARPGLAHAHPGHLARRLHRAGSPLARPLRSQHPAAHRRLRPQRVRDAHQLAGRHPHQPRRPAALGAHSTQSSITRTTSRACTRSPPPSPRPKRFCAPASQDHLVPVKVPRCQDSRSSATASSPPTPSSCR